MKIISAQLNYIVGDLLGNCQKILNTIQKAPQDTDIIVFSETAITGYPPLDLVQRKGFVDEQLFCLTKIAEETSKRDLAVIIGYIDHNKGVGKRFKNCLAVCHDGVVQYSYSKRLLPTYNIFDESRHFEPGEGAGVYTYKGVKLGLFICEDMWNDKSSCDHLYTVNPIEDVMSTDEALQPDLFISINASPSDIGKIDTRHQMFLNIVRNYGKPLIYVNQVGGNDDIIFDGSSFAISKSGVTAQAPSFEEFESCYEFLESGKDLAFIQNCTGWPYGMAFVHEQLVLGIQDYVRKVGFKKVVVGCSGGVDSALVLTLAVEALGNDSVIAITMPSAISSKGSVSDSEILCKNLDIPLLTFPISDNVNVFMKEFNKIFGNSTKSVTKENLQARIRGMLLMAYSNEFGSLVLSTGNKSECAVGYCTLYGDMNGGLAPISDLYKTEVWELCRYINKESYLAKNLPCGTNLIPLEIVDKEPSAELYENQKDTDSLPPYPVLDAVLRLYIEGDLLSLKDIIQCRKTIEQAGFKDFEKILRMVDNNEFKRRQAAPTIRVHKRAWGFGRRLPIAQKYKTFFSLL